MRKSIQAGTERAITSEVLKCPLPRSDFILVITTGKRKRDPYISANLYLLPGTHSIITVAINMLLIGFYFYWAILLTQLAIVYLSDSQLEKEKTPYHLLAELRVRQRSKKRKQHQNIYSHSSLLDNLPNSQKPPVQGWPQTPPLPIQESAEGHTLPIPLAQERPHPPPIQEEAKAEHTSLSPPPSPPTHKRAPTLSPPQTDKVLVASFPLVISHQNFMNEQLVTRPYFTLVFTLMQYRLEWWKKLTAHSYLYS